MVKDIIEPGQKSVTVPCQRCSVDVVTLAEDLPFGRIAFARKHCAECRPIVEAEMAEASRLEKIRVLEGKWRQHCPPLYRETDISRLTIPQDIIEKVLSWQVNPRGIGIAGRSGTGKTRLMFLLLRRVFMDGNGVRAISGKRFERSCHLMFDKMDEGREIIRQARDTEVLFLDDLGKERYTDRVESEFYDLVEHRTSHLLPILWTTNSSGDALGDMMSEDRGAPIIRRLREFTEIIVV